MFVHASLVLAVIVGAFLAAKKFQVSTELSMLLAAVALVAPGLNAAHAKLAFEPAPTLPGSELAPAAMLKGPLHTVAEPVSLDGYFGRFDIESKFGKFSVLGVNMLGVRVHELHAIEALQKVDVDSIVEVAQAFETGPQVRQV